MSWLRYLVLGDLGQQLDIQEMREKLDREAGSKSQIDVAQDVRLARLEAENRELELRVAVLIRLLLARGLLTQEEIASMFETVEAEGTSTRKVSGPGE